MELLLNGKSLGSKPINADASPRVWTVPFEVGLLHAVGKNKGAIVASEDFRTAGRPVKVVLSADRPTLAWNWNDVAYVTARVVDANGITIPGANNLVEFKVSGPGAIAAVDNADNSSHEPFQASSRHAYQGECVAIIRAGGSGRIVITASAGGLEGGSVAIEAAR